jgi:hypothetical protein
MTGRTMTSIKYGNKKLELFRVLMFYASHDDDDDDNSVLYHLCA